MKLNFMLIDDNEVDIFLNTTYLKKEIPNCTIKTFMKPEVALSYLSSLGNASNLNDRFCPEVILCDINMPQINGFQFLEAFKKLDNYASLKNIKVYLLSSSVNAADIKLSEREEACSGYINKPLTARKIETLLNEMCSSQNAL